MTYDVEFYQKENGEVPVEIFLLSLSPKLRAKTFREIELLKNHGPDLREPHTKPIKGKNNQKTNKTPERELEKARKYKEDYERRCEDE